MSSVIPTGNNSVPDDREFPRLSSRVPAESPSSEDQLDDATNGSVSNEDSSADEAPRNSIDNSVTRMNEESEDEENGPPVKVISYNDYPISRQKPALMTWLRRALTNDSLVIRSPP